MKTSRPHAARILGAAIAVTLLAIGIAGRTHAQEAPVVRIGVFDGQTIFAQYPGQQRMQAQGQQLQEQMQQAAQAQDHAQMQQLQQQMQQLQNDTIQGFFEAIRRALPDIAREAGVQAVAQQVEFTADGVEEVDLTQEIARALSDAPGITPEPPPGPAPHPPTHPHEPAPAPQTP